MARACHPVLLIVLSLSCGCGGSERSAQSAANASDEPSTASSGAEDGSGASEEAAGEASAEPAKATCDDGTCTPCGSALCPSGWYCDETAKGGPACGWLPECATKPTCACLEKTFRDCACEDQGGAAHLRCG